MVGLSLFGCEVNILTNVHIVQCGFCGAEFKTKEKLKQHQFSNHGSTRPAGPAVGET